MRVIKVAIMPKEKMQEYTIGIAKGKIKADPDGPKIFFPSMRAMAEAFNENSQGLIAAINTHHPGSINELASLVEKDVGNVSRTLKRLKSYGLVELKQVRGSKETKPVVLVDKIEMEMTLTA